MIFDPPNLNIVEMYNLIFSMILPRPIALIATVGQSGIYNLAPFSSFAPLCLKPTILAVGIGRKRDGQKKDTLIHIEYARDFVVNVVDETLAQPMNQASFEYPIDVSEFKEVGLTPVRSDLVKAPRVAESPVNLECRLYQVLEFGQVGRGNFAVLGEVVRIHLRDELWQNGQIDPLRLRAIGRLGGDMYCHLSDLFTMVKPFSIAPPKGG